MKQIDEVAIPNKRIRLDEKGKDYSSVDSKNDEDQKYVRFTEKGKLLNVSEDGLTVTGTKVATGNCYCNFNIRGFRDIAWREQIQVFEKEHITTK